MPPSPIPHPIPNPAPCPLPDPTLQWRTGSRPIRKCATPIRPHADPLPDYLSVAEARQLITHLSAARSLTGITPRCPGGSHLAGGAQSRIGGLQLGAGLTPGDVRGLTLDSPVSQGGRVHGRAWKLHVPGDGNSPARETPVAPWAAELLRHWLTVRAELGIAGPFLFPSTRTGKQWLKPSQYESARRVLEEAVIDSQEGGSFRLRHTFAIRQLRRGTAPEQVARWMGIEPVKMKRY